MIERTRRKLDEARFFYGRLVTERQKRTSRHDPSAFGYAGWKGRRGDKYRGVWLGSGPRLAPELRAIHVVRHNGIAAWRLGRGGLR
jgi:hypothetical protein